MSKAIPQCPFLDGADARCSNCFRLEDMKHAFKFCFGRYRACPTYLQLQVEGRMRGMENAGHHAKSEFVECSISAADARGRAAAA